MKRKLIPCIYLKDGKAVKSFSDRETTISENPAALAKSYGENGADEILVLDFSEGDAAHEAALEVIRDICLKAQCPVIGAGNVKRMEDVKKLLYAGCKKAVLNYSKQSNIDSTEEISLKFGSDRLFVCISDKKEYEDNKELIEKYFYGILEAVPGLDISSAMPVIRPFTGASDIYTELSDERLYGLFGPGINEKSSELYSIKNTALSQNIPMEVLEPAFKWEELKKNEQGMIPVIVQDYKTDQVLMLAYMNEEAYYATLSSGRMTYYSRSREKLWLKGEESGHFQYVKSLSADCDLDTILAKVSQVGAACHTGSYSCFFNDIAKKEYQEENPLKVFESVMAVIEDRKINPREGSYTNYLFDKGIDKILKKLGEEATEIVIASKNPAKTEIKYEIADFLYHMMVLMAERGVTWEEVTAELARR